MSNRMHFTFACKSMPGRWYVNEKYWKKGEREKGYYK